MTSLRLTGTLRTFGGVTAPTDPEADEENEVSLIEKGRRQMLRKAEKGLTWKRLEAAIKKRSRESHGNDTTKLLRDLIKCASGLGTSSKLSSISGGSNISCRQPPRTKFCVNNHGCSTHKRVV